MKTPTFRTILIYTLILVCPNIALAGGGAYGHDMWTESFSQLGLFTPHLNNCTSSEAFVAIAGGSSNGFCIEKSQRSAQTFEVARDICASIGSRLPEPAEFKYACNNPPTGLTNMTGDWEWASNYATNVYDGTYNRLLVVVWGNTNCKSKSADAIGDNNNVEGSYTFRCVH